MSPDIYDTLTICYGCLHLDLHITSFQPKKKTYNPNIFTRECWHRHVGGVENYTSSKNAAMNKMHSMYWREDVLTFGSKSFPFNLAFTQTNSLGSTAVM